MLSAPDGQSQFSEGIGIVPMAGVSDPTIATQKVPSAGWKWYTIPAQDSEKAWQVAEKGVRRNFRTGDHGNTWGLRT
jgi:hypothetical protein